MPFRGDAMKGKRIIAGVLTAVLVLGTGTVYAAGPTARGDRFGLRAFLEAVQRMLSQTTEIDALVLRREGAEHLKYMDGDKWGRFRPEEPLTRAEAAVLLCSLLDEPPSLKGRFSDVPDDAPYAEAVCTLARAGVLPGDAEGRFRPEEALTRAECAQAAAFFLPEGRRPVTFDDVPDDAPYYDAVCKAAASGLFRKPADGLFHPDDPLTRAEAAAVFNRLLGRTPDPETIRTSPLVRVFPDVPVSHWAYEQIMEATIDHEQRPLAVGELWTSLTAEPPGLADGFHSIEGRLYCVQNGYFLYGGVQDGFRFDEEGHYTTGRPALDRRLSAIIRDTTDSSMTDRQKLRAVFNYVRDNFTYIPRALISSRQSGWEPAYAEAFLRDGRGNCFSFAAAFCLLARQLGFDAHTVVGELGRRRQPHGWVEIEIDGRACVFDPELEMKYNDLDFFQERYENTEFEYFKP